MKKNFSLLSVGIILLTLSACHQKPVKSVVTPLQETAKQEVSSLVLLPLNEYAHVGWTEIELAGRKWYVDAETVLTRNELASLSFVRNDKGEVMLHIFPDQQGQNKINNALGNKDNFILMVLNDKAISLSKITSPQVLPFYVGDNNRTIKVAEEILQKKLASQ
ncbi:hypothetical protein [Salmonella enterica]|uniref:Lipoprotein n=1 Tax=Salmonella enterica TaxID=28901 RepID=A0A379QCT8_SALER|nr:hypothetical protein [Salmonella enterica]SUF55056.1 Uncharacterised protein [Salmonella enterica]